MAGPAAAIWTVQRVLVQGAAAISFYSGHHLFRFAVRRYYNVDMVCANVSGQEGPTSAGTHLLQAFQYDLPAHRIQPVRLLSHSLSGLLLAACIGLRERSTELILCSRHGPDLARQPSSVANPRDQTRYCRSLTVAVLSCRCECHRLSEYRVRSDALGL